MSRGTTATLVSSVYFYQMPTHQDALGSRNTAKLHATRLYPNRQGIFLSHSQPYLKPIRAVQPALLYVTTPLNDRQMLLPINSFSHTTERTIDTDNSTFWYRSSANSFTVAFNSIAPHDGSSATERRSLHNRGRTNTAWPSEHVRAIHGFVYLSLYSASLIH